jgi:hypothetical protein
MLRTPVRLRKPPDFAQTNPSEYTKETLIVAPGQGVDVFGNINSKHSQPRPQPSPSANRDLVELRARPSTGSPGIWVR